MPKMVWYLLGWLNRNSESVWKGCNEKGSAIVILMWLIYYRIRNVKVRYGEFNKSTVDRLHKPRPCPLPSSTSGSGNGRGRALGARCRLTLSGTIYMSVENC